MHPRSPCSTCPYRKDAPLGHWHPIEFRKLLASEGTTFGAVYACHGQAHKEPTARGMCAGWLLDQKKRDVPSIALRVVLLKDSSAVEAIENVTSGGAKLFSSVRAMCRANGVR